MNTTGRIPTGNARLDCASGAIKAIGALSLAVCTATCALAEGWTSKTISINFSGSRDTPNAPTDADFSGVSGAGLYGALPVAGDNWNNFQTHRSGYGSSVSRSQSIKLGDGMIASGVSAEWDASCTFSVTGTATPNNIFHSFLDGSDQQFVTISGLTAANGFPSTCTVYIYCSSDRNNAVFGPKSVNGVTYTYADGVVKEGSTSWGSRTYAQNNKLVLGGDYLKITNVQVSAEGTVSIAYANCSDGSGITYHGTLSAVQLDFSERSEYALSVNFSGGQRKNDKHYGALSGADVFGALPVRGDCWNNSYAATAAGMDGLLWNDGAVHANAEGVTLSFGSYTWANTANVVSGNLLHSYLDDTNINVTIDGLTEQNGFPRYCRVHVYMSTPLKSNIQFEPIVVNGTAYTWNGSAVCQGTTRWGNSSKVDSNEIALGWNYLDIGPIEIPADGRIAVTTFDYLPRQARGCIAAVQIEFAVPEAISVSASCAAGSGTVQLGDGEAGTDVSVAGVFGEPVTTTMKATAADGLVFVRWRGPVGLFASGSATDAEVTVKTSMAAEFAAEFISEDDVHTARWTGEGTNGDLSDPENWTCFNVVGAPLDGKLPGEGTTVVVAGETSFALPANSSLHYAAIQFDNASLLSDSDMSGLDIAKVLGGSTIDLRGKTLTLLPADGSCNTEMTITDSSAVGAGGSLVLIAANGATFTNLGITLSGTLKLVKDGEGMYVPLKSGQSYTGGTHVKMGTVKLGTHLQPLGPCDKTQTVRVEKGATLDINRCHTGCFYNYELGGTIVHEGDARIDSWNPQYLWMPRIELIDDAHISGGWFYFGSSDPSAPSILSLKGHTLYMDLARGEVYAHGLEADATGGKMVFTAGALQSCKLDLSSIDIAFTGDSYEFLATGDGGVLPVKGFAYERNYWMCHSGACEIQVHGSYKAGACRPPITMQDGSTLDISAESGCWSAEGILSTSINPNNVNRAFSQPGQVSFADEATITVNLAGRADLKAIAEDDSPYIVTWSTPPADSVKFKLDAETRQRGYSVKVRSNGLALLPPRGFMLLVR